MFTVTEKDNRKELTIELAGSTTTPSEFAAEVAGIAARLPGPSPLFITGRAPIWGYAMLIHAAHATPAIAVYDPRLGYVVVSTHSTDYALGQILARPIADLE